MRGRIRSWRLRRASCVASRGWPPLFLGFRCLVPFLLDPHMALRCATPAPADRSAITRPSDASELHTGSHANHRAGPRRPDHSENLFGRASHRVRGPDDRHLRRLEEPLRVPPQRLVVLGMVCTAASFISDDFRPKKKRGGRLIRPRSAVHAQLVGGPIGRPRQDLLLDAWLTTGCSLRTTAPEPEPPG